MIYTIYDPITGKIECTIIGNSAASLALNLEGKTYIEGGYDDRHYYILDGQPVPKAEDPSDSLKKYSFDDTSKTWVINAQETDRLARMHRDQLLKVVDKINPVWWTALSSQQQAEVITFRQLLLDVPQQAGFPIDIVWPIKPNFL